MLVRLGNLKPDLEGEGEAGDSSSACGLSVITPAPTPSPPGVAREAEEGVRNRSILGLASYAVGGAAVLTPNGSKLVLGVCSWGKVGTFAAHTLAMEVRGYARDRAGERRSTRKTFDDVVL